jgi:hemerythrin-like domain-containing protein
MDNQSISDVSQAGNRNLWYSSNIAVNEPVVLPRTIRALHNEHIYISNLLDSIEEQIRLINAGREADFKFLLDIVDYMKSFPDRFHHPKEDLIFQRVALRDDASLHDVQLMLEEHRFLEALIERVGASIDDHHLLPTVQKRKRVGELCAEYVQAMRQHINKEETVLLPRAVEVLREEDWYLIDQQSTPIQELPIEDALVDNYAALRRRAQSAAERLANTLVLAEYLGNHAMLEIAGGLGASISHGRRAYRKGSKRGWQAYLAACKSWLPLAQSDDPRFQNPIRMSWQSFIEGVLEKERPRDVEMTIPVVRSLKLYAALMGGLAKPPVHDTSRLPKVGA